MKFKQTTAHYSTCLLLSCVRYVQYAHTYNNIIVYTYVCAFVVWAGWIMLQEEVRMLYSIYPLANTTSIYSTCACMCTCMCISAIYMYMYTLYIHFKHFILILYMYYTSTRSRTRTVQLISKLDLIIVNPIPMSSQNS